MKAFTTIILSFFLLQTAFATQWHSTIREAKNIAQKENKLILVDFYADWCTPCKILKEDIWLDAEVKNLQSQFISVRLDIDNEKEEAKAYSVANIPSVMIADALGNEVYRSESYLNKEALITLLKGINADVTLDKISDAKKNNETSSLNLAKVYQSYVGKTSGAIKQGFLHLSSIHFDKAKKTAEAAKNQDLVNAIILAQAENELVRKNNEKVTQVISRLLAKKKLSEENKATAYFILAKAYHFENKNRKVKRYKKLLQKSPKGKEYLQQLEILLHKSFSPKN